MADSLASSIDCVVGNCHIRNLCVAPTGRLTYFKAWPHDTEALRTLNLKPNARSDRAGNLLPVDIVDGPIERSQYSMVGGVHLAMRRLFVPFAQGLPNIGHTLGDEVVSAFRALEMWELLGEPLYVYLDDLQLVETYALLPLARPPALLARINRSVCLAHFLVGWRHLGYMPVTNPSHTPPLSPMLHLLRFRDFVLRRFHIAPPPRAHAPATITILQKLSLIHI